jgi:hypothetical protein
LRSPFSFHTMNIINDLLSTVDQQIAESTAELAVLKTAKRQLDAIPSDGSSTDTSPKKRAGRPKGSKNLTREERDRKKNVKAAPSGRRGRPKGSKNLTPAEREARKLAKKMGTMVTANASSDVVEMAEISTPVEPSPIIDQSVTAVEAAPSSPWAPSGNAVVETPYAPEVVDEEAPSAPMYMEQPTAGFQSKEDLLNASQQ